MANEELAIVQPQDDALLTMDYDNIIALGDRAEKMVTALKKVMNAALSITTELDWCIIGGNPYLQESGTTKVSNLFGISTRIHEGYPKITVDSQGYPTYTYRINFTMGTRSIDCDGSRAASDEFFAGKKTNKDGTPRKQKSVDEIPLNDVCKSAYTNCMNTGIKQLIPGLRNIDISNLTEAGLDVTKCKGYVFKTGSKGGNSGSAADSGIVCSACGAPISQKVASFSEGKFGRKLCMKCQDAAKAGTLPPPAQDAEFEELPPHDDADLPFK